MYSKLKERKDQVTQAFQLLGIFLAVQLYLATNPVVAAPKDNSCDLANAIMPVFNNIANQFGKLSATAGKPLFYVMCGLLVFAAATKFRKVIMSNLGWILLAVILLGIGNSVYDSLMPGGC